ncbi:hypothetical protein C2E23DRAFT_810383 [Lenzites betulinus]|nr:hypothetical protein C2E23DRAFT_810383 [Lenzites betulinus]
MEPLALNSGPGTPLSPHSNKRQKLDSAAQRAVLVSMYRGWQRDRERDKEHWYEDGNIIIVAAHVEFRVYKGILADHSPIFKDMFALPQPADSQSTDVPEVHVSDEPEDLRHMLQACMPKGGTSLTLAPDDEFCFERLSALIRLGHKYEIQPLVTHAVDILKKYFPTSFDEWILQRLYNEEDALHLICAMGVVNLARLVNEPSLLPTALLTCCEMGEIIMEDICEALVYRPFERLPLDDIGQFFKAIPRLTQIHLRLIFDLLVVPISPSCESPDHCREVLQSMTSELREYVQEGGLSCGCDVFSSPTLRRSFYVDCCETCDAMMMDLDLRGRREAWTQLPGIMGVEVDGWPKPTVT